MVSQNLTVRDHFMLLLLRSIGRYGADFWDFKTSYRVPVAHDVFRYPGAKGCRESIQGFVKFPKIYVHGSMSVRVVIIVEMLDVAKKEKYFKFGANLDSWHTSPKVKWSRCNIFFFQKGQTSFKSSYAPAELCVGCNSRYAFFYFIVLKSRDGTLLSFLAF